MASLQEMILLAQTQLANDPATQIGAAVAKGFNTPVEQAMKMYELKQRIDTISKLSGGGEDKTEAGKLETTFGVDSSGGITASIKPRYRASQAPDGYEIVGQYQDGTPMIKKKKEDIRLVFNDDTRQYSLAGDPSGAAVDPNEYSKKGYNVIVDRSNPPAVNREDQFARRRISDMVKYIDPSNQVRSAMGVAKIGLGRAQRLDALATAMPDYNKIPKISTEELAIGLNSIMQGSNVAAQQQVQNLVPRSAVGSVNDMLAWVTNEPRGLGQQKFVKFIADTIKRESTTMQNQLNEMIMQRIAAYPDVEVNSPEAWSNALQSFGIDPEEYRKLRANGFKFPSVIPEADGGGAEEDPVVKTGTDAQGRKVGKTKSGKVVYIN